MSAKTAVRPQPKMMRVAPNVIDPSMKNPAIDKDDPEKLLREMGEETDEELHRTEIGRAHV